MQRARCNELPKCSSASQLPLFLGWALTQLTNGKLVFLHMSLFACLAVRVLYLLVSVMMLTLITTDCTMLLMSSDNFETRFQCLFHSGQVTRFVVPFNSLLLLFFSVVAPSCRDSLRLLFRFLCLIPQNDRSGLVPAENVEYVHSALHDEDSSQNLIHWLILQCHFLQIPGIDIILQYIESQIISQCIPTVVLVVPRVCLCQ